MHKLTEAVVTTASAGPWQLWFLVLFVAVLVVGVLMWPMPESCLAEAERILDAARANLKETDQNLASAVAKNAEADHILAEVQTLRVDIDRLHEEALKDLAEARRILEEARG